LRYLYLPVASLGQEQRRCGASRGGGNSDPVDGPSWLRHGFAAIDRDARLDGCPAWWARILTWHPPVGLVLLGLMYGINKQAYYWIMLEDHPVEWAQFAFLVCACLVAVLAAARLVRTSRLGLALILAGAAVLCFDMAGEEISWGQRVFQHPGHRATPPLSATRPTRAAGPRSGSIEGYVVRCDVGKTTKRALNNAARRQAPRVEQPRLVAS
jgi:hypothetical protein